MHRRGKSPTGPVLGLISGGDLLRYRGVEEELERIALSVRPEQLLPDVEALDTHASTPGELELER